MSEIDLTAMNDVVTLMEGSRTEQEWNRNCDQVKRANGGMYPDFWYGTIVLSGLAARVSARWGSDATIRVSSIS